MTIQASELRIGNLHEVIVLSIPRMGIRQITIDGKAFSAITGYGMHLVEEGKMEFKPIPLTEEWLLRFGFNFSIRQTEQSEVVYYSKGDFWLQKHMIDECYGLKDYPHNMKSIRYVHELQNVYYFIKGQELTLRS